MAVNVTRNAMLYISTNLCFWPFFFFFQHTYRWWWDYRCWKCGRPALCIWLPGPWWFLACVGPGGSNVSVTLSRWLLLY